MVIIISLLLAASIYFVSYQFLHKAGTEKMHLPSQVFDSQEFKDNKYAGQVNKPWLPLTSKYKGFEKRIPVPFDIKHKLLKAGSPMGELEFLAIEAISTLLLPVLSLIIFGDNFPKHIVFLAGLGAGLFLPILWLNKKIKKRQFAIRKDLPNLIDLLNICVSGGLDFMLAVNRVIKDMKPCELTRELNEVYRQTQMGATRREALKNFAWRIDMPEVNSFARTLVQADRMGTSIGDALKMQSEESRVKRFQRGEAMALKAPIKLLFPLFVFILPVVLLIVAGPILLNFMRGNMNYSF